LKIILQKPPPDASGGGFTFQHIQNLSYFSNKTATLFATPEKLFLSLQKHH
jgi:hypothetical protein